MELLMLYNNASKHSTKSQQIRLLLFQYMIKVSGKMDKSDTCKSFVVVIFHFFYSNNFF